MRVSTFLLALVGQTAASVLIANSSVTSQVRVAFHGDTGMVVSWNTFQKLDRPTVNYGLSADALTASASSDVSVTYATSLTYNNHVWIDGLLPDTTYYYQPQHLLANETVYGPYTFKTARPAGDFTPYSIAFVCDMGTMGYDGLSDLPNDKTDANEVLQPGEQNTIQSLAALMDTYDFVVHPGDLAYSDYWLKEELADYIKGTIDDGPALYETILNEFYDEMEAISAYRPYMIGVGNHEANCDNGGAGAYDASICVEGQTNFTGIINHFRMPSDVSGGVGNFWYSFDYGMTHYVMFNTETDLGNGLLNDELAPYNAGPFGSYANAQVDWLVHDLTAVDRCATPWVVALGHRPWQASGDVCTVCGSAFGQLLEDAGVDLVLQGHFHVYERNLPMFANGTIDPHGYDNPSSPWYIINGLGGHWGGMDEFTYPLQQFQAYGLDDANAVYGWSRLHFFNATHVQHEFVASNNNSVIDSTVLYKNHVCPSAPSSPPSSSSSSRSSATATSSSAASSVFSSPSASSVSTSSVDCSDVPVSSSLSAALSASLSSTILTVLSTTTYTVASCATTVTNCPVGKVTTDVITLYTTYCPETTAEAVTGTAAVSSSPAEDVSTPAAIVAAQSAHAAYTNGTTGAVATNLATGGAPETMTTSAASATSGSGSGSTSSSTTASGSIGTVVTAGAGSVASMGAAVLLLTGFVGAAALL